MTKPRRPNSPESTRPHQHFDEVAALSFGGTMNQSRSETTMVVEGQTFTFGGLEELDLGCTRVLEPPAYTDLPEHIKRQLQDISLAGEGGTSKIYCAIAELYDATTLAFLADRMCFDRAVQKVHYVQIDRFHHALRKVVAAYRALNYGQRVLARGAFIDPETHTAGTAQGGRPINGEDLPDIMDALAVLAGRLESQKRRSPGRPRHGDLTPFATAVRDAWERNTGRSATWDERGGGGLHEFHSVCSGAYDVGYKLEYLGGEGLCFEPVSAFFSAAPVTAAPLHSVATSALRKAVRQRARAKKTV